MDFYHWFVALYQDAVRSGCSSRVRAEFAPIWAQVYLEGVAPKILAVIDWAEADPERFADLRETEIPMVRKPVQSERIAA